MTNHTRLMTSLVKLTTSKHGSIRSHWFLKKMNWTPTSVERFQFQRDMRLKGQGQEDHLIPHVSSLDTPKEMFDSLIKLFEGRNKNQKMTLIKQLNNVKDP